MKAARAVIVAVFAGLLLGSMMVAFAEEPVAGVGMALLGNALGAGLAMGLSALGAGIALGRAGSAASSALAEKPELFGRLLVFLVLGEGLAIYGLVIALLVLVLNKPA